MVQFRKERKRVVWLSSYFFPGSLCMWAFSVYMPSCHVLVVMFQQTLGSFEMWNLAGMHFNVNGLALSGDVIACGLCMNIVNNVCSLGSVCGAASGPSRPSHVPCMEDTHKRHARPLIIKATEIFWYLPQIVSQPQHYFRYKASSGRSAATVGCQIKPWLSSMCHNFCFLFALHAIWADGAWTWARKGLKLLVICIRTHMSVEAD